MSMQQHKNSSLAILWLTAAIWGFAFVAQRAGMQNIGPFTFNGIRFILGSLSLLPFLLVKHRHDLLISMSGAIKNGLTAGVILFLAASLQQAGMVWTSAGKAGFITGLYVIIIPVISLIIGQKVNRNIWVGAMLAVAGLFMLTISEKFTISSGDYLVLASAVFWAIHVQLISVMVRTSSTLWLSSIQFLVCGVLSLLTAFFTEAPDLNRIMNTYIPILYGGMISVGVAYTLQVIAQKHFPPAKAGIILSFETVFAVIGG